MPNGATGTAKVPVADHPTMLFLYKFDQATMLRGLPAEVEDFRWVPISIFSKEELDAFVAKYHWDCKQTVLAVPVEFARMVAKIAYSFAVGEFGLDSFTPLSQTLDVILNRTNNVSYTVGGDWEIPPPDSKGRHILVPTVRIVPGGALIVVEVRLFPAFETPQFRVVIGRFDFHNSQHLTVFEKKMKAATIIQN